MRPCLALLLTLITLGLLPFKQSVASETVPTVAVRALVGPLYLLQGRGGNVIASVGSDGILLVDSDDAALAGAYQQALDALARGNSQVNVTPQFVVNTHWHSDHSGANAHWGGEGAVIVAHHNVRKRLRAGQAIPFLDVTVEPASEEALPVVTYGDAMTLHFNAVDVEIQHYPDGHTDGDSVVFFAQQNVMHTGDLFFMDRFPFIDLSSGGNALTYRDNVARLLARIDRDTLIVPGHGPTAKKIDLERFHLMLEQTIATVQDGLSRRESLDAVIRRGLGQQWASWGSGFIDEASWIRIIAASLDAAERTDSRP